MGNATAYEKILDTIPIDTGGLIRVGMLDLTRGYGACDLVKTLDSMGELGTDARDLRNLATSWNSVEPIEMESGTLFRIAWFYFTKMNIPRQIIPVRTLVKRVEKMELDPDMVNWSLAKQGTPEGGTSQYQTAAILFGNQETLEEIPFYVRKTYNIRANWEENRATGKVWDVPRDPTLITQSKDYIHYLQTGEVLTIPDRLGDCDLYPFLRIFGAIGRKWGEKNWPQLAEHESNRFKTADEALTSLREGKPIVSDDHRIVEAAAQYIQAENLRTNNNVLPVRNIMDRFSNPNCVSKKWYRFWEAMTYFPEAALEAH